MARGKGTEQLEERIAQQLMENHQRATAGRESLPRGSWSVIALGLNMGSNLDLIIVILT